jgi:alpha-glucosidase
VSAPGTAARGGCAVRRKQRAIAKFAATAVLFAGASLAAQVEGDTDRYLLRSKGLTLEVSAPRDDIVRIRAAQGALAEDASWAVPSIVRGSLQPLHRSTAGASVELRTHTLTVRIERVSLRVTVLDAAGRVVLDDAPGRALEWSAPGAPGSHAMRLRKQMPAEAHFFGLGDKAGPLDRRGQTYTLWNTDAFGFGEASDPLYKSVPFVLGVLERGPSFGLFFDNTWRSFFDFGKTERDTLSFGAEGGAVDYYVMVAADPKGILGAYAYLTGCPPLPALWTLGFQQSRYSYGSEAEARAIAQRLRADRIPADALYLDIDYQDRNRPFTVSADAFPNLPKLVADLGAMDLGVVLITDLHIADAPDQNYRPYDSGIAQHAFVRRPDGTPYVGEVWPGPSVFPDFSRSTVRDWWGGLYGEFVRDGIAGFWNDMNEPAIFRVRDKTMPLDVVHRIEEPGFAVRDASHAEMHNVYGMLNSRATYEGLLRLNPDRRPFVLTRASYAGGQRYAATWTGDNTSTWNHLRLSVAMLVNLGLSGFAYAGDDIGGYAGAGPSPDLLTRWIEIGAFNPLFRDHAQKGKVAQEPWVGSLEQQAIRRRYIEERYRLLPYIYALAEQNSRSGLPLMRPVFLEFPGLVGRGDNLGGSAEQFMLGPDLLIAPAPELESPYAYSIALPGPGWFDYWTGLRVAAAKLEETPRLERLPVFVRPGAIVPRQPLVQSTRQTPQGPLELAVYPGGDCQGQIYLDDGVSFAYRRGVFLRQNLRCAVRADAITLDLDARDGSYAPWWNRIEVVVHGVTSAPRRVRLGDSQIAGRYDAASETLRVEIADSAAAARLTIDTAAQSGSN